MIWIPDAEYVWHLARVISCDDDENTVTVKCGNNTETFKEEQTYPYDPSHGECPDDLCTMNNFHEASLLDALRTRYAHNTIYTNIADVTVVINPYKLMPHLYDNPLRYLTPSGVSVKNVASQAPHVYKVSND